MPDLIAASKRLLDAYNAKDFALLRRLISPAIDMAHFNRNYAVNNADELIGTMELFAAKLLTNRRFEPAERVQQVGDFVIREGYWSGTPDVDIPGFGTQGEPLRVKLCSVMRFDANEVLVEWKDYG